MIVPVARMFVLSEGKFELLNQVVYIAVELFLGGLGNRLFDLVFCLLVLCLSYIIVEIVFMLASLLCSFLLVFSPSKQVSEFAMSGNR